MTKKSFHAIVIAVVVSVISVIIFVGMLIFKNKTETNDLAEFITHVNTTVSKHKPVLRQFNLVEPLPYNSDQLRDPFVVLGKSSPSTSQSLTNFPLEQLKLLGTMLFQQRQWAVFFAPDGLFYQVSVGDTVGQSDYKVSEITNQDVKLVRVAQGKAGTMLDQTLVLTIQSSGSNSGDKE